jgi:GDP-4-dehydro-6-deoxy-D-mannose reductase
LEELLYKIIELSGAKVEVRQDPSKMRPVEIVELVADVSKTMKDVGWELDYSMDRTIEDLLNYWRFKFNI